MDESRQGLFAKVAEDENVLPLRDILRTVWSRLWVILLVMIVLVGTAVGFSLLQTPKYEASVKILVGQRQSTGTATNLGSDVQGLQQLTRTLAEAVNSRPVTDSVIEQLNLDAASENQLTGNMRAQQIPDTQFIQVSYTDPDPDRAQLVANTVGDVFSDQISNVSPNASNVTATVWERAVAPDKPVSPNLLLNVLLALVLGLVLGLALVFLLEYLDDSWRSPEEAERVTGVPNFGVIPRFAAPQGAPREKGK